MKHIERFQKLTHLAIGLWLIHGVTLFAAVTETVTPVVRAADIAREKDVVWLSLVTAIVSLLFSAWLVRQMVNQTAETIRAINALTQELRQRSRDSKTQS